MGLFRRRYSLADTGLLKEFTDHHCHILPGVDDGVPAMEDSLAILERYESLGIREVWLTPHIMEDVPNTTAHLRAVYDELCARYGGSIRLHLAAEYMMDSLFEERLRARDLLPLGRGGGHLLVETSYFNPPARMTDILRDIRSAGYFPVLAHPERYTYMDMEDYSRLNDEGIWFQLNLPSLAGMYGKEVQKKARLLLKHRLYHIVGTDLHRSIQIDRVFNTAYLRRSELTLLSSGILSTI